jgi:hypothetical protein
VTKRNERSLRDDVPFASEVEYQLQGDKPVPKAYIHILLMWYQNVLVILYITIFKPNVKYLEDARQTSSINCTASSLRLPVLHFPKPLLANLFNVNNNVTTHSFSLCVNLKQGIHSNRADLLFCLPQNVSIVTTFDDS